MMSKRRLESGAGCFTDVSCELTDEQYDTLTANAFPEGSQIPFESASPKDEAVSITVSATDRTKSDKNMRF
jgi:hypothetical protein